MISTASRVLYDVLAGVFTSLGFDALGDDVFRDLVIARIVEPTSILDTGRVLIDLGFTGEREDDAPHAGPLRQGRLPRQARRVVLRPRARRRRCLLVSACDVTTLYLEAKRRTTCARSGTPRSGGSTRRSWSGCWSTGTASRWRSAASKGPRAETLTLLPVIRQFQARHGMEGMVVVADAGMLSAANLRELDEAGLGFIVGSRTTKAPVDLESHFRWHGDAFTDGRVIDNLTPRAGKNTENNVALRAEPVWNRIAQ